MAKPNAQKQDQPQGTEKLSFEQALEKLEQIVSQIEEGQVSLEQSIERYAEGIQLIKKCRAILERAEQKIQILAKAEGASLEIEGELPEEAEEAE
jgi:exodeoxyribonuclease VII small subunit